MMKNEASIERYLVDVVTNAGGLCLKGAVPGQRFVDRICILPGGRVAFVELKRSEKARRTVHQVETIERLQALGHEACFIWSVEQVGELVRGARD